MTQPTSPTDALTIGFDIGGTNLRGGVVTSDGTIIDQERRPTPKDPAALIDAIVDVVTELRSRHTIDAVGLAVAGFLDADCATVRFAPHLPWRNTPVKDLLEERIGLPVRLEHDANAAAWGEYRFGAAQGHPLWVLFAVGTGIGGAIMIDGNILRGSYGTAGEFGHVTAVPDGIACACGKQGCLERYCSGTALEAHAHSLINKGTFTTTLSTTSSGADIMRAARAGDPLARAAVDSFATWMGQGFAMVADILDPALIVLGGGVVGDADLFLPAARREMEQRMVGAGHRPVPEVTVATLGSQAGLIGVADLAHRAINT